MYIEDYGSEDARARLQDAIRLLWERDLELLRRNVNERSISHRLAEHLRSLFEGWDVDCEYNRMENLTKVLPSLNAYLREADLRPRGDDTDAVTVFPDVIVHQRGERINLLVLELKKDNNRVPAAYDLVKLKAFRDDLGYRFTAFVQLCLQDPRKDEYFLSWKDALTHIDFTGLVRVGGVA